MRVVGLHLVEAFKRKHPTSRKALDRWIKILRETEIRNFSELRRIFPAADLVGTKTVFNIGGNKVRAITLIEFGIQLLVITAVLTHAEYDKGTWRHDP